MTEIEKSAASLREIGSWLLDRLSELRNVVLPQLEIGPVPNKRQASIVFSEILEESDALWQKILQWLQRIGSSECGRVQRFAIPCFQPPEDKTVIGRELIVRHFQRCFAEWEGALRHELEFLPVYEEIAEGSEILPRKTRRRREPDKLV